MQVWELNTCTPHYIMDVIMQLLIQAGINPQRAGTELTRFD